MGSESEIEILRSTLVFPSDSAEMVARTPPKSKKILAALNPLLIRETLNKVIYTFPLELQYSDCRQDQITANLKLISYLWMFEDGPVHGSASGTSVYCGRWDEGGVGGESQPS